MDYMQGKGAQIDVPNRFSKTFLSVDDFDGLDEELRLEKPKTEVFYETPKKIIAYNQSPDIRMDASVNPYQGCEHGCVYCYARNSHQYWGFGPGLDFESKIVVKKNAAELLEKTFLQKGYKPQAIMLSGNTDCYQPLERKFELTRQILEVCLKYRHPVGIVTKNAMVTRDIDILSEMAKDNLAKIIFSITSENEALRRLLEPRTASAVMKFKAMNSLKEAGIPVGIMTAPVIPYLTHHEIPSLLKKAAENGASFAGYTVVRLNGQIAKVFRDWLEKNFPDRASKVWHQIQELHNGNVNDSEFGRRISGGGKSAEVISQLFKVSKKKYFRQVDETKLDHSKFRRGGNYTLF